jgi:hypothetical protein
MISHLLRFSDIYGYVPSLQVNNKKSFQTDIGGILSILTGIVVVLSVWYFGKEILYKTQPNVMYSNLNYPDPLRVNFTQNNFLLALGLQNPDYSMYINESIYSLEVTNFIIERKDNGSVVSTANVEQAVRCSEINITLIPSYFKGLDLNNLYCLKNGDFYLQGDFGRSIWVYSQYEFKKCKNSTKNNFSCQSQHEIENRLQGGFFGMFIIDYNIILSDFDNPLEMYGKNLYTTFSNQIYKEFWLFIKANQIFSDSGWLFQDTNQEEFFNIDYYRETWDFRDNTETFLMFAMRMSLNNGVYNRNYIKCQDIAAKVGGIIKFVLLIGELLSFYFKRLNFKDYLVKIFFNLPNTDGDTSNQSMNVSETKRLPKSDKQPLNLINNNYTEKTSNNKSMRDSPKSGSKHQSMSYNNLEPNKSSQSIMKVSGLHSIYNKKMKYNTKYLNCIEVFLSPFKCLQKKEHSLYLGFVSKAYRKLKSYFDWVHFLKLQNEQVILKRVLFNSNQIDIISHCMKLNLLNIPENYFKFYTSPFSKLPKQTVENLKKSYLNLMEMKKDGLNEKIIQNMDLGIKLLFSS